MKEKDGEIYTQQTATIRNWCRYITITANFKAKTLLEIKTVNSIPERGSNSKFYALSDTISKLKVDRTRKFWQICNHSEILTHLFQ